MSKNNKNSLNFLPQDNSSEDKLTVNSYLPLELECFKFGNYFPQDEEQELTRYQKKILTIQWSLFLGIILLNLGIHLPQINASVREARINSVQQLVNINLR